MTVELQIPPIAQQGRVELGNLPRSGAAVEARVVAMLADGTARLSLMGQTIDVSTPYALQAGSNISVAVVREGGNLKLVLQQDAQAAPQPQAAPVAAAPKDDAAALLFATVKAGIISALLESTLSQQTTGSGQAGTPAQSPPAAAPPSAPAPAAATAPEAQPQTSVQTQPGLATVPNAPGPAGNPPGAQPQSGIQARQGLEVPPQASGVAGNQPAASPAAPSGPQTAAQSSTQVIFVPIQLPQMAQPLMLRVEQEQEDNAGDGAGQEDKRAWTVSVSVDAGALGLVHVGIGLRQGAVSVRLSATDVRGAAYLSTWLPELKSSLEQADFVTGELSAVQTQVADLAGQGQSYTV